MVDLDGAACLAATLAPPQLPLEVYRTAFGEDEQCDQEGGMASSHSIVSIRNCSLAVLVNNG